MISRFTMLTMPTLSLVKIRRSLLTRWKKALPAVSQPHKL
ncbi:hypothetical protein KCP77_21555 [Salmonella enterica subsp. enterica]|nr:hypothetical protein KCP77_21555 [Salmonella enterica subsp. enterica]